jgi:hypothetical protein
VYVSDVPVPMLKEPATSRVAPTKSKLHKKSVFIYAPIVKINLLPEIAGAHIIAL